MKKIQFVSPGVIMCLVRFPAAYICSFQISCCFFCISFLSTVSGKCWCCCLVLQCVPKRCLTIALVAFALLLFPVGGKSVVIRVSPTPQGTMDKGRKKCESNSARGGVVAREREGTMRWNIEESAEQSKQSKCRRLKNRFLGMIRPQQCPPCWLGHQTCKGLLKPLC